VATRAVPLATSSLIVLTGQAIPKTAPPSRPQGQAPLPGTGSGPRTPPTPAKCHRSQAAKAKGPMKAANRPRITNGLVLNVTMRWVLPVASQPYTLGDGGLSQRPWGAWCRLRCGWNLARRVLRSPEGIVSGCEVNWLIDGLCCERLPAKADFVAAGHAIRAKTARLKQLRLAKEATDKNAEAKQVTKTKERPT
jgi:hypothetical protein